MQIGDAVALAARGVIGCEFNRDVGADDGPHRTYHVGDRTIAIGATYTIRTHEGTKQSRSGRGRVCGSDAVDRRGA